MKKKVISALLASTMIVSLVACGSTGGDSSDASSKRQRHNSIKYGRRR